MKSHLSTLSLSCLAAGLLLRKSLPIPITSRVFPSPSCSNFRVSGLIFRFLIYFELILVQGDKHECSLFLADGKPLFPAIFVEEADFSPSYVLGSFVKNELGIVVWIHIWVLYSVLLHVCVCASTMLFLLLLLCNII
jgi:hypothetical protein